MNNQTAMVVAPPTAADRFMPLMDVSRAVVRYQAVKDFIEHILKPEIDYGAIPGTGDDAKKVLKKPGAEKLASFFGLATAFETVKDIEDWDGTVHGGEPLFYYRLRCTLTRDGVLVASAEGSCNSRETKYRYREGQRKCPVCGKPTIIRGKAEYGGGWLCFAKKGGCGEKFLSDDPKIASQTVGRVPNPDVADQANTILKMAQKRALVAAVLNATNASDVFTQDVEDFIEGEYTVAQKPPTTTTTATKPTAEEKRDPEAVTRDTTAGENQPAADKAGIRTFEAYAKEHGIPQPDKNAALLGAKGDYHKALETLKAGAVTAGK